MIIDTLMTSLLVASFAYPFSGNAFHEVNGILLAILFVIHNMLNRKWYLSIFKGRYTFRRSLGTAINLLLIISMLLTLAVAVPISITVFAFLNIDSGAFLSQLHIAAANWVFILVSMHLGIHWDLLLGRLRRAIKGADTRQGLLTAVPHLIGFSIALYGLRSFFNRTMGPKLIMYYTFGFGRSGDSILHFILDYLSIMALCIWVIHYTLKISAAIKK